MEVYQTYILITNQITMIEIHLQTGYIVDKISNYDRVIFSLEKTVNK